MDMYGVADAEEDYITLPRATRKRVAGEFDSTQWDFVPDWFWTRRD